MGFPAVDVVFLFLALAAVSGGATTIGTSSPRRDPMLRIGPVATRADAPGAVLALPSPAAAAPQHPGAEPALAAIHSSWVYRATQVGPVAFAGLVATPEDPVVEVVVHEGDPKGWKWFWRLMRDVVFSLSIWLLLTALFACYWDQTKEYRMGVPNDGKSHLPQDLDGAWKFPLWDCCGDPCMCCLAVCCPAVRWADTVRMSGLMGFGCGVTCFVLCQIAYNALLAPIGFIPLALVGTYYRQKLRKKFDMPHCTASTMSQDCLIYSFCSCLAINQEARTLEEAYVVRHPAIEHARDKVMQDFEHPASWGRHHNPPH